MMNSLMIICCTHRCGDAEKDVAGVSRLQSRLEKERQGKKWIKRWCNTEVAVFWVAQLSGHVSS